LSESRRLLDIPPINVNVKLTLVYLMPRVKKNLSLLSVLFSLELLSPGFLTNRTFSWSTQHVPPLLKAASHTHARAVKLDSPAETDGGFVLERYGEPTPRSGGFLTAKENWGVFLRSFIAGRLFSGRL